MKNIYIGWDSREPVAYDVCKYSIGRRASIKVNVQPIKHRSLRAKGLFWRPWNIDANTGLFRDLIDGKNFSTEFSHTRFLVPVLNNFKGWALFMDSDMLYMDDIKNLFDQVDDKYALMVVKHRHKVVEGAAKMDGQINQNYHRKNWSSFVLWNCAHPLHANLNPHVVNGMTGSDLHAFSWVPDEYIGHIGYEYNWIEGTSPAICKPEGSRQPVYPKCIHYTSGGPWFEEQSCKDVMYAEEWTKEYEHYMRNVSNVISNVPTTKWEG